MTAREVDLVFPGVLPSARMNRALGAAAIMAVLASGCASRGAVHRLQSELDRLRTEMSELRSAQDTTSRDVTRARNDLAALDARLAEAQGGARSVAEEIARLSTRADAAAATIGETRTRVEKLAASATARPSAPAEALHPVPPAERRAEPEQAYAAALATFRAREHGQAVLDFLDFITKYPKHPLAANAQNWIGEAYYVQRDYRQALVEFQKVLEHGERKAADALLKVGLCYVNLRDTSHARQAWMRVINEHPRTDAADKARAFLRSYAARHR